MSGNPSKTAKKPDSSSLDIVGVASSILAASTIYPKREFPQLPFFPEMGKIAGQDVLTKTCLCRAVRIAFLTERRSTSGALHEWLELRDPVPNPPQARA
jgi:hypothetical protein